MTADVHFVQEQDAPILIGSGDGTLSCACGSPLIEGFRPAQFLGVGIQCGRCGTVTSTAPLPDGDMLPRALITAEPVAQPRPTAMTVPADVAVVGRTEMDRLGTLFRPATPPDTAYAISAALLDEAETAFEACVARPLPAVAADPADPFAGLREHALSWAVRHLRRRIQDASWACTEDAPTANAALHVAGFLHFVATWSRHPLFQVMAETADERGFSLHGLALFAAAHAMAMAGNRVGFQKPLGYPARINGFDLAVGATEVVSVSLDVFDRFEFPFGRPWDQAGLRAAVSEAIGAAQGRINLRNPGLLLLSPGTALAGYDEALIEAVQAAVPSSGRHNRGLMAVAPIVLRLQPMPDPHAIRIGYGLFPVQNRRYTAPR
jgi:hypothetical protein